MAERFISPGVFTTERDLSFLPAGIAQIGAAFIGPTTKGPAFVPTIVESQTDFERQFGISAPEFYAGHAIRDYLGEAARATVVRVLGLDGYAATESTPVILSLRAVSGSGGPLSPAVNIPVALLFPSRNTLGVGPVRLASASLDGGATSSLDFDITLTNSNGTTSSFDGLSLDPVSPSYFVRAFGESPASSEVAFVLLNFPRATDRAGGQLAASSGSTVVLTSGSAAENAFFFSGSTFGVYDHASTPFVRSQTIGGTRHNLFKVHTFSDGNAANRDIKVSIASTKPAVSSAEDQHGTFALLVRSFNDTDSRIDVLEQYDNLSLDPDSPNYIARRIGDQRWETDADDNLMLEGEFRNLSRYVWVEVAPGLENVPDTVLPAGFSQLRTTLNSTFQATLPSASFVDTRFEVPVGATESVENVRRYYGYDFDDETNLAYLNPIPSGAALIGSEFSLEDVADGDVTASIASGTIADSGDRKFTVPFQGGFDGLNPSRVLATGADIVASNTQGFNLTTSTSPGSRAYQRAINVISNDEAFDINLLVLPGVLRDEHSFVTQLAIDMAEERGDTFYIMDAAGLDDSVDDAVNAVLGIDSNYVGTYHPWVKILDVNSNKLLWVPPSVVMPGVYAFNDKVAAEWFAPAGLNRGGITSAVQVRRRLTRVDRDDLYDGRVNPIALFPGQGIAAFGQKTLQVRSSALDRINVRRLLIAVKKFIASTARFLVFEQNVDSTRQRFLNIVNPFLASVQERSGLFAFRVVMDESNNTADLIDRNILVGQLFLQPTRVAEFLKLEFNILPTGATFEAGA